MKANYQEMPFRRCGNSGLLLPALSLGLWHNFSQSDPFENCREMLITAFESGIVHLDLANNYGPPTGDAEIVLGRMLREDFSSHRDELLITTKAGHPAWEGPYGDWGSRKSMLSSLDQSLKRLGLDYVDIFYSHRFDPETPLEETMGALDSAVRSGKALYVGLSKYPADKLREASAILRSLGTPFIVDQRRYSMLVREAETQHFALHCELGLGCVSFSPLAQGLLSTKYLAEIPEDSRASKEGFLKSTDVLEKREKIVKLNEIALRRGQTLSQMAISWQLNDNRITSVLIGASSSQQIKENLGALQNCSFSSEELAEIDALTLLSSSQNSLTF